MIKADDRNQYCAANERVKYKYRSHLARALKKDAKTVTATLQHLRNYEAFTGFVDFREFNDAVADKYVTSMTDNDVSMSYINDNIRALKEFMRWLVHQVGYKSKINYNHIDYLNISDNQKRTAKATEYKKAYHYDQILQTIRLMPSGSIVERRNKAMISLQALCGLRPSELRTVKIKNLIEEDGKQFVYVNPKDMQVKYAKVRQANFMELPPDIVANVNNWKDYLIQQGFKDKDPLFPKIDCKFNQSNLLERNLNREGIKSNTSVRDIFRDAFNKAGFDYLRPHSIRHTSSRFAEKQNPEFLNAVRQSLGHSSIDTTLQSYGQISDVEQRKRIANLQFDFDKPSS